MTDLRIGGVPEHFNYPWYLTLKNKEYKAFDINLRWKDFPGGTGDMCKALRNGDVDIAIVLTEGIIKDITEGNPSKILQTYVETPLIWGVHVSAQSHFQSIADLENKRIAISRFGSGSHLMAIVNAYNQGWNLEDLEFVVVKNLAGGINALQNGEADYFLWEHFTTKPYVDQGIFNRVGDCPTPWSCFLVAVRDEVLKNHPEQIRQVLEVINQKNKGFKNIPRIDTILSKRYDQQLKDIQKWLSITEWNHGNPISTEFISEVQNKLLMFNVIKTKKNTNELIKNMYF
jgi:ABC-type nitrate/sulfonate/bicarbonate transport system substrate-binding protein